MSRISELEGTSSTKRRKLNPDLEPKRLRASSASSSGSSSSSSDNLLLTLAEEREQHQSLKAAEKVLRSVDTVQKFGFKFISDSELRDILLTLCKYTVDATKRLKPGLVSHLRLNGTDRGLTEKYHAAYSEAERRKFNMSLYDGSRKKAATQVPRRPLPDPQRQGPLRQPDNPRSLNNSSDLMETPNDKTIDHLSRNQTPISKEPNLDDPGRGNGHEVREDAKAPRPGHQSGLTGDQGYKPTTLGHTVPSHHVSDPEQIQRDSSKTLTDVGPMGLLPEEDGSIFHCKQCRRGPATCMHAHKMLERVSDQLHAVPVSNLLFAVWLIENWDENDQDAFGQSGWDRRLNRAGQNKTLRQERLKKMQAEVQSRKSTMGQRAFEKALVSLEDSLDQYRCRSFAVKHPQDPKGTSRAEAGLPAHGKQDRSTRNGNPSPSFRLKDSSLQCADLKKQKAKAKLGENLSTHESATKTHEQNLSYDLEELEDMDDSASDNSEDSLIQTRPPSIDRLLATASKGILARIIKTLCSEDRSVADVFESMLMRETSSKLDGPRYGPSGTKLVGLSKLSPATAGNNVIDRIAGSEDDAKLQFLCSRCGTRYDTTGPDGCVYHDGDLKWTINNELVGNPSRLGAAFGGQTSYSCCKRNGNEPGCKTGTHLFSLALPKGSESESNSEPMIQRYLATLPGEQLTPSVQSATHPEDHSTNASIDKTKSVGPGTQPKEPEVDPDSIPDYAPALPPCATTNPDALLEKLTYAFREIPLDITHEPGVEKLLPCEQKLASRLRWLPSMFLLRKRQLFQYILNCHKSGETIYAADFSKCVGGSNTHKSIIFQAYRELSLFERHHYSKFLDKESTNQIYPPSRSDTRTESTPIPNSSAKMSTERSTFYTKLNANVQKSAPPSMFSR